MSIHDRLMGSTALELKEEGAPDVAKAIADMQKAFDEKMAAFQGEVKAANDRADALEVKMNRPGLARKDGEATPESKAFASMLRKGRESLSGDEIKALTVSNDTGGGVFAPPEFLTEVIKNLVQISPVRQAARVGQTTSQAVRMPKRTANLTAYWVGETEGRTGTQETYGQIEIPIDEMACYVDVSNQLLEDSAVDINAELAFDLAQEFGRLEGAAFVNGDAIKKPTGILNAAGGVAYIASGTSGSITGDGMITAFYALPSPYRARAAWMMNSQAMGAIRTIKDGQGRYIWVEGLTADQPPTLLGRPVYEAPDMPAPGANTLSIAFGDFNTGYRIYDRLGLTVLRDPFTQATNGLTRFHARRRVGGAVVMPEALRLIKLSVS